MFRPLRRTLTVFVVAAAAALLAGRAMAADAKADAPAGGEAAAKKKVVFYAGGPSHRYGEHDHKSGCYLLAKRINHVPGFEATVYYKDWPEAKAFDGASAVVMYCDGGNRHMALQHLKELQALHDKGVGIGCIHYAVEPGDEKMKGNGRAEFLEWIGGYFETFYSVNPHWDGHFDKFPQHPVASGLRPFANRDEWYYHMRFRDNMEGVTPVLSAVPPDSTRKGKDDPHGGNPHVREGIGKDLPETVVWVSQNKNGSRGFGCTGAHFHWNWAQDDFRKAILNSIVWIARGDVPASGVESSRPTMDELMANEDEEVPPDFDKAKIEKQIEEMNKPQATAKAAR